MNVPNDSVLLSLDFPSDTRAHDCYQIVLGQSTMTLEAQRKRIFSETAGLTLAVAVSSYRGQEVIITLCRDGILPAEV